MARYISRFNGILRQWQVYDTQTKCAFGRFDTRRGADKRATELQVQYNKKRPDYGMKHSIPAPASRAYKD